MTKLSKANTFSSKEKTNDAFQRDIFALNFCKKKAEKRNSDGWKKYFQHCKKRSQGEILQSEHHHCFAMENGYAPYFEFNVPNVDKIKVRFEAQSKNETYASSSSEIKEHKTYANLRVLSMFIQRGPYSGTIYQPKINHHLLDIGMKENYAAPHSFSAFQLRNFGAHFTTQD